MVLRRLLKEIFAPSEILRSESNLELFQKHQRVIGGTTAVSSTTVQSEFSPKVGMGRGSAYLLAQEPKKVI